MTANESANFEFSHLFKNGTILYKNPEESFHKRVDSYAAVSADYTFCIENLSNKQEFSITFLSGIELSDINFLPGKEEGKNIDRLVDVLNKAYE